MVCTTRRPTSAIWPTSEDRACAATPPLHAHKAGYCDVQVAMPALNNTHLGKAQVHVKHSWHVAHMPRCSTS